MNEYTVFALNSNNEHFGDALFVGSEHLGAAVDALIEYWVAEQDKADDDDGGGVHCEVHEGSVRDGYNWKALPWQPGDPVIEPEAEAQRKLSRDNRDRHQAPDGGVELPPARAARSC